MEPHIRLKTRFKLGPWLAIVSMSAGILTSIPGSAAAPAWWLDGNPPVLTGGEENNRGPATIGQAKWVVSEALRALEVEDADAEAAVRQLLTQPQPDSENPGQNLPAILDLTVPADPKPEDWAEKQRAPLLVGQLKALSAPFYDVLHGLYPDWLNGQLIAAQTKDAADPDNFYPWTSEAADDQNSAIATIGQLKAVFSLRFETLPPLLTDEDLDGMDDAWEIANGLDPADWDDAYDDPDFDGISNLYEYLLGFDPWDDVTAGIADASKDTDGDGMPDIWEVTLGHPEGPWWWSGDQWLWDETLQRYEFVRLLDWEADDSTGDPDSDGLSNLAEFTAGTDPFDYDTDGDYLPDGWEVDNALNPKSSSGSNGQSGDPDEDGIQNQFEYALGFHPTVANPVELTADRDNDGMPDHWEAKTSEGRYSYDSNLERDVLVIALDWETDDSTWDLDSDGLSNLAEFTAGTVPFDYDTDGDYLPDGWEVDNALNPKSSSGSNGRSGDPDGDGIQNQFEYVLGFHPTVANPAELTVDRDNDGMPDHWEAKISEGRYSYDSNLERYVLVKALDWNVNDADGDYDSDGLTNLQEYQIGTDVANPDSDFDLLADGWEILYGFDPLLFNPYALSADPDGDGASNFLESLAGTDPNDSQSRPPAPPENPPTNPPSNPPAPPIPPQPPSPPDLPASLTLAGWHFEVDDSADSLSKFGFEGFIESEPPKRFLKLRETVAFQVQGGGQGQCEQPESRINGSRLTKVDPLTGEETVDDRQHPKNNNMGGVETEVQSETLATGSKEVGAYNDHPNLEGDCDSTKTYTMALAVENTTEKLVQNLMSELPAFSGEFEEGTPHAYRDLAEDELAISYKKTKYRLVWDYGVAEEDRHSVKWLVVFQPETPEGSTESPPAQILRVEDWSGNGEESQPFLLDPESERPGEDGEYYLVPMKITFVPALAPKADVVGAGTIYSTLDAPEIHDAQADIGTISEDSDGTIRADITLRGSIQSKVSDAIAGAKGRISQGTVTFNGSPETTYPLAIGGTKGTNLAGEVSYDGEALPYSIRRYPFDGFIGGAPGSGQIIPDVPITEGVNIIDISAYDGNSKMSGFSRIAFEVLRHDLPDGPPLAVGLPDQLAMNIPPTPGTEQPGSSISLSCVRNGTVTEYQFLETAPGSALYQGEGGEVQINVTASGTSSFFAASLTVPGEGLEGVVMRLGENAENGGFGAVMDVLPLGDADVALMVSEPYVVEASESTDFVPFILRADGLEDLAADVLENVEFSLGGPESEFETSRYKFVRNPELGIVYLEDPNFEEEPMIFHFFPNYESTVTDQQVDDLLDRGGNSDSINIDNSAEFVAGFAKGFALGLWDVGYSAGEGIVGPIIHYKMTEYSMAFLESKIYIRGLFGGAEASKLEKIELRVQSETLDEYHESLCEFGKASKELSDFILEYAGNDLNAFTDSIFHLLDGNIGGAIVSQTTKNSETHALAAIIGAELITRLHKNFGDASAFERGVFSGRCFFEIVAVIVPYTKLGKLAEIEKVKLIQEIQNKGIKLGRLGNRNGIGVAAKTFDELAEFIADLLTTRMCFVAGTLVVTANGPIPIEAIEPGDIVLSRDEFSHQLDWKAVRDTFVTHPDTLFTIYFSPEDGGAGEGSLTGTASHPFWVVEREAFVTMEKLEPQMTLYTADGRALIIARIEQERAPPGQSFTTYNFEVEDFHTYFVGESGVWVHNTGAAACQRMFSLFDRILDFKNYKGNLGKGYDNIVRRLGNSLDQDLKSTFVEGIILDLPRLKDAGKVDPHIIKFATDPRKGFVPEEAFAGSRFELISGKKLVDRDPIRVDPVTGNDLPGGDFIDELGDLWDAVGPLPKEAFSEPNRLNGFFNSIVSKHVDVPEKGNVIVDLAGLPPSLKQRALDTVKGRLSNPAPVGTNVELALDNGKRIILLDD